MVADFPRGDYKVMRFLIVVLLAATCCLGISGCSAGRQAFNAGRHLEQQQRFEDAMYRYADAMKADPEEGEYRTRFFSTRERAAQNYANSGDSSLTKGDYTAAAIAYQAAAGLDPTIERYRQQAERTARLRDARMFLAEAETFEKEHKFREAASAFGKSAELDPDCAPCVEGKKRVEGYRKSRLAGFGLMLKSSKPITLKFKDAKLKTVFSVITQLSGINFVFDDAVKDLNVTLALEQATFDQSLDLLSSLFKLGRKTLNESTVIIYPATPEKVKQYEDMVVGTFHLDYMDAKKAVALLRNLMQIRKIHVNDESNSFMVRDSREVVEVIGRILDAYDLPEPEVLLDVEVLEISNKNIENLGLLLSNYSVQLGTFTGAGKLLSSSLFSSSDSKTPVDYSQLLKAFSINSIGGYVTVPNAQYNFGKTLTKGEVLSNPKIRVKNREKSKFTVGTRVPITTSNTTNSTVSVNVQYVDVGVKVNAEPVIQMNNEVTIKLGLEVSSILSREKVGSSDSATVVATIGTRNLETVLSLKDGETSVIGGLISRSDTNDKNKIYLLGDLPLLGPLLSNTSSTKDKTELVLAITPRLVRGVTIPKPDLTLIRTGREDSPSLVQPYASFEQEALYITPGPSQSAPSPVQSHKRPLPIAPIQSQPSHSSNAPALETSTSLPAPVDIPSSTVSSENHSTIPVKSVSGTAIEQQDDQPESDNDNSSLP